MTGFFNGQKEEVNGNVLFLGDSISDDGKYVSFFNTFVKLYFPSCKMCVRNIGVSSETVAGLTEKHHPFPRPCLLGRLSRALEELKPDWVFLFYGINDGIYFPFSNERFQSFKDGYYKVIEEIHGSGAKIIVMTPPIFDNLSYKSLSDFDPAAGDDENDFTFESPFKDYDDVMERYSQWILQELSHKVEGVVDVHKALKKDRQLCRAASPKKNFGDGVHPDRHGHLVIAKAILKEIFNIQAENFEELMEKDRFKLFSMVYKNDLLWHNYEKEHIGHDNPWAKAKLLPKDVVAKKSEHLDRKIDKYIAGHKKLTAFSDKWNGFCRQTFYFNGCKVIVVKPKQVAINNPWVWRTEFFGAFPSADIEMVKNGFHIVSLSIPNYFGSPCAVDIMKEFYDYIIKSFELNEKSIMFGFSRGGLYAVNYAAKYPLQVSALYLDAPVLDISSWPGGKGNGCGSNDDWEMCLAELQLSPENAQEYRAVIAANLNTIAAVGIPLVLVAGDNDGTVPYLENGVLAEQTWKEHGIPFKLILKQGCDHHPHSLKNPEEIVSFLLEHTLQ